MRWSKIEIARALATLATTALFLAWFSAAEGAKAETASLEYALKATYLYKFAPFVEWPPAAFPAADTPINICVAGTDPFGVLLDQAVAGQRVGGRPIAVHHIASITAGSFCHIAFIAGSPDQSIAQSLEALRGQPVLTVTDNAADAANRGIISFVIIDNRVRFQIDEQAAVQNHITLSSKLLSLSQPAPPH